MVTECVPISTFASLSGTPIGIASSVVRFKICVITVGIRKYKLIIKKKRKKHNKIVWLAKSYLNTIDVLISKDLIEWHITHDEFVSVNNVLQEYDGMKEKVKNLKTSRVY